MKIISDYRKYQNSTTYQQLKPSAGGAVSDKPENLGRLGMDFGGNALRNGVPYILASHIADAKMSSQHASGRLVMSLQSMQHRCLFMFNAQSTTVCSLKVMLYEQIATSCGLKVMLHEQIATSCGLRLELHARTATLSGLKFMLSLPASVYACFAAIGLSAGSCMYSVFLFI